MTAKLAIWSSTAVGRNVKVNIRMRQRPRWNTRTVDRNRPSDRPPDPASSRMRADAKQDGDARHDAEPSADLAEVPRGAPHHARRLVLLLAAVLDTQRERAALVVGICELAAIWKSGDDDDLALAKLHETILPCYFCTEYL